MTIQLQDVKVLDNPATFTTNFKFQITFDCVAPGVKEELEWKLVYVGSADNEENDQELDSILVGPVRVGKNRFTFEAPSPDPSLIPCTDLLDVTVILLTCSYKDQEFIRIGYYVHNEYEDKIDENDENVKISLYKIKRNILSDKPRVTRFNIKWDNAQNENENEGNKSVPAEETKEKSNNATDEYEPEEEEEEEADDDEDDDDEEEEEEERDEDFEEDLDDTEQFDNENININNNNNKIEDNKNNNDGGNEDDDIDMTE